MRAARPRRALGDVENSAAPVDLSEFHRITDGDPTFAQELIAAFISSGEQQLNEIAAAIAQNDCTGLAKAAHKLKGASANIHARALKSLAERLEIDSAATQARALQQGNALLRREFDRVKQFLTDPSVVPQSSEGRVLVAPALQVRTGGSGSLYALQNLRQVLKIVVQTRIGVGLLGIAVPAVFSAIAVGHRSAVARLERFEPLLPEINGVRQIIIVAVAHVEMNLALQLGRQRFPVARNNE